MKDKHILFVTTSNLTTNPRLYKELLAIQKKYNRITCILFDIGGWSQNIDSQISFNKNIKLIYLSATRKPFIPWLIASIIEKTCFYFYSYKKDLKLASYGISKRSWIIVSYFKKNLEKLQCDLVIGHNIGALYPVFYLSSKLNIPFAFDAEDFHRGELDINNKKSQLIDFVENKILPKSCFVSAASPLICKKLKKLYPKINIFNINNVFAKSYQKEFNSNLTKKITLFWFSQNVGLNRGLQDILRALNKINDENLELIILGHCREKVKEELLNILNNDSSHKITFLEAVSENKIFDLAKNYSIGLALEPSFSVNNNIALSNKIFTYLICGNALILSETDAQKHFIQNYPSVGFSYEIGNIEQLVEILNKYIDNKELLESHRKNAWKLANKQLNWEVEQQKWLNELEQIL